MLFAGMLFEGGIVGYDTNVETGGNGARYLGIGANNTEEIRVSVLLAHLQVKLY